MKTKVTQSSVRSEVNDPNRISPVYQVLYVGPADYDGTPSEKEELTQALRTFQLLQASNSQIVKIRASFLLGLFQVWTKTRQAAENLIWSFDGYERRYEVVELHYDRQRNDYLRSPRTNIEIEFASMRIPEARKKNDHFREVARTRSQRRSTGGSRLGAGILPQGDSPGRTQVSQA